MSTQERRRGKILIVKIFIFLKLWRDDISTWGVFYLKIVCTVLNNLYRCSQCYQNASPVFVLCRNMTFCKTFSPSRFTAFVNKRWLSPRSLDLTWKKILFVGSILKVLKVVRNERVFSTLHIKEKKNQVFIAICSAL